MTCGAWMTCESKCLCLAILVEGPTLVNPHLHYLLIQSLHFPLLRSTKICTCRHVIVQARRRASLLGDAGVEVLGA